MMSLARIPLITHSRGRRRLGILRHQEDADACRLSLRTAGASGDDQLIGPGRRQHDGFLALQDITVALLFSPWWRGRPG